MAGDWIKMRVDLGDDPAVVQIAEAIGITEDEVVGKLHRLWSWADKHTTDGTAPAITSRWVDRYVACPGFAVAMEEARWVSFSDAGITFPNFDRHNGESAKKRGEAAIRQRLSRKNRDEGNKGEARSAIPRPFIRHVMERDQYTCVYCGKVSTEAIESSRKAVLSVDHIKPITRGGTAAVENLACCCRLCNSEKSDRTPEEWGLLPTFLQQNVTYKYGQMSQKTRDIEVTREREEKRREEQNQSSVVESGINSPSTTTAGSVCARLRKAGVASVNPSNPKLLALIAAGLSEDELADIASEPTSKGKGFAWILAAAEGRRRDAAAIGSLPPRTTGPPGYASKQDQQAATIAALTGKAGNGNHGNQAERDITGESSRVA